MSGNRLLMLMPYQQFVRKAMAQGFRVYSIWDPTYESADYLKEVEALSEEFLLTDFSDVAALRRLVAETAARHGVDHVLHLGREDTQFPVCEEAHALGLALNPPGALRSINDKAEMRRLLHDRGLSPMRTVAVPSPAGVRAALDGFDLPVVVKPTGLDGSRAVRLLRDAEELSAWTAELARYGYDGPVLVEEQLRGPEFSVEALTVAGRHHIIGITAKRLLPSAEFVEAGHLHPAPLPAEQREAMTALVVALLDGAGYRFGPSHTEIILTRQGPRVVESQTRIGGDRIPLLVEVATGFDVESAIFEALRGAEVTPVVANRLASVEFFDIGAGRLESVDGLDEIRALPFVHALTFKYEPGDVVPTVTDSGSRHGHVVVDADSPEQASERIATVLGLLRTVVRPE
ncbi:ATP-grasp domain-containing protein [Actinoplanes sp. NPDC049118]|uniref:ATP-grasp domain-containing protein n=1 Tax=Actinoplanes sp. NPDC049118 TaxID=3155769 RepID=UPI0033FC80A0